MVVLITYFKMYQHSLVVLFISMLFQFSFAKYFLISIFNFVEVFPVFLFVLSDFSLMSNYDHCYSMAYAF